MVLIFSFVVLVELPKRGHVSRRLPFLCQPCSGLPYTFLVLKNVVHRTTKRLKYFQGTQRVWTRTWFGRTEKHDRGHVTPNKFPGQHSGPALQRKTFTVTIKKYEGRVQSCSMLTLPKLVSFYSAIHRGPVCWEWCCGCYVKTHKKENPGCVVGSTLSLV